MPDPTTPAGAGRQYPYCAFCETPLAEHPEPLCSPDDLRDRIQAEFPCCCDVGPDCPWHGYAERFLAVRDEELERLRTALTAKRADVDAMQREVYRHVQANVEQQAEVERLRSDLIEARGAYAAVVEAAELRAERDALKAAIEEALKLYATHWKTDRIRPNPDCDVCRIGLTLSRALPKTPDSPEEIRDRLRPDTASAAPQSLAEFAHVVITHLREHFTADTEQVRQVLGLAEEVGEFVGAYCRWAGMARRTGPWSDVEAELADVVITAYVTAEVLGIDLEEAWRAKAEHIMTRGWRDSAPETPEASGEH